ncbi:MAG TPA: bifunctional folylpolyglutamate synthase/dihydrofolate synthase, partial [bacterium]|nr:bifunctional folylpolyglutamate synthase/dihydrofolate synthase [bacterium]
FRAGLYTSPHLVSYLERIRIGKAPVTKKDFAAVLSLIREMIGDLISEKKLLSPPTHFEILTCMAFLYFSWKKVDIAVLEVGMGGRFDATNVVTPLVSVITTISSEHQKFLGKTLREISLEKAGIIKPGIPVVCGVKSRPSFKTIKERAEELEAPFYGVFAHPAYFKVYTNTDGYSFEFATPEAKYSFTPALLGEHQGKNAAIAIAASEQLNKAWKKLEKDKIIKGIETASWPGRLEKINQSPFVILDGAHNEEGAIALRHYIQKVAASPIILIFAVMRDKKIKDLADILFPLFDVVLLTRFPYYRAAEPEDIKKKAQKYIDKIIVEPDPNLAMRIAIEKATLRGTVVVAGSLFLVGEIKKYWKKNQSK